MLRTTAIAKELAVIERKLQETTNKTLKDALKKKQARLKDELNDFKKSTPSLAKKLLAQRAQIKQLSKLDFNDLVRRLSKKPEYSFLRTMSKSTIRTDIERPAKPVGWRFKGRGNYDKPTIAEIKRGKRNGTVYREVRPLRSDVSQPLRLETGGGVKEVNPKPVTQAPTFKSKALKELKEWKKEKIQDIKDMAKYLGINSQHRDYIKVSDKLDYLVEDAAKIIKSKILKDGKYTMWKTFKVKSYKGEMYAESYLSLTKYIAYEHPKFEKEFEEFNKQYPYSTKDDFTKEFIGRLTIPILGYKLCDYTKLGFMMPGAVGGARNNQFEKGGKMEYGGGVNNEFKGTISDDSAEHILKYLGYNFSMSYDDITGLRFFGNLSELKKARKELFFEYNIESNITEQDTMGYAELRIPNQIVDYDNKYEGGGTIQIGDKVKASKEYGGKSGVVVDKIGSFVTVEYSNGQSDSYHESDLIKKMEKGGNMKNTHMMEDGGVVGQEIVFDDNGEENTGVIKDIHEITGNYVVLTDDGRTVLADKELDVISLGKMRAKPSEAKKRFAFFEDGGNIAKENNEMLQSQAKEAKHHIEELHNILTSKTKVEPWVVAKMTRAKTDLSDITHYLEGMPNKMMRGGKLTDEQQDKFNKVMGEWKAGKLHSGSANGPIVKSQDQAVAIAYSEAYGMDKMLFGGMVNDLSDDIIDRMEGLVPISTLDELLDNAKFIIADMYEEGFEKDEIMSFLAYKISQIGNAKSNKNIIYGDQNQLKSLGLNGYFQYDTINGMITTYDIYYVSNGGYTLVQQTSNDPKEYIDYLIKNLKKDSNKRLFDKLKNIDNTKMVKGGKLDSKSLFDLEYGDVFSIDRNPERPHTMTSQYFMFIAFSEKYAKPEGVSIEAAYFPGSFYGPEHDDDGHTYLTGLKNGDITIISKEKASEMLLDYQIKNNRFEDGGKMNTGGGVGSLAPNLLMELWYAVWERKTEKYDEIAKKLDKEGVSFTIQNAVSEDAQNTRSRKAIDTFEVQDRIKKIMGNTKMKTGGGVGSKNTDYIEVTNEDTVLSLEKSNGVWEEVDVLQGVKPVNFGRNTYKGNMKHEALLKALNAEYGGGYEVAYVYMKMSGGKMETGSGITATFEEWSKNYPIEKQADNFYRLYYTKNNFTIKYSKDKSKLEEYRKMMYDLHKSTKYSKMAKGGMTEHGLKRGDTIVYNSGNDVMVIDKNKNQKLIDIDKGERYLKGGSMSGWKHKHMA
jgi:hypothetical protein